MNRPGRIVPSKDAVASSWASVSGVPAVMVAGSAQVSVGVALPIVRASVVLLGWSLTLPLKSTVIVSAPAAIGVVIRLATPLLRSTVPRVVDPSLEGHGAGRYARARADDTDRGGESDRLAEYRRRRRCRRGDVGGVGGRCDGDRTGRLTNRRAGDGHGQGIAGAGLVEGQAGERGEAVVDRRRVVAAQGCAVGVAVEGDRHGAARDGVPLAVFDLDLKSEGLVGADGCGRLGGDGDLAARVGNSRGREPAGWRPACPARWPGRSQGRRGRRCCRRECRGSRRLGASRERGGSACSRSGACRPRARGPGRRWRSGRPRSERRRWCRRRRASRRPTPSTEDPLSVLVKTSYSWATPESMATSGSARAPVGVDAGGDDAGLPGWLGLDGAQAAAAAAVADSAIRPIAPADLARWCRSPGNRRPSRSRSRFRRRRRHRARRPDSSRRPARPPLP